MGEESVAAFNEKFGGATVGNTSKIFEINFSDDPWKMSTSVPLVSRENWRLSSEQPFLYLTCDGCGHMGYGLSLEQTASVYEQVLAALREWSIPATPPASSS